MIHSVLYKKDKPAETGLSRPQIFNALSDKESFVWVDLENPTEFEQEMLIEIFNFHDLAIEDCINDQSHPKVDDYDDYLFLVVHEMVRDETEGLLSNELDVFIGKNYVVTYHYKPIPSIAETRAMALRKPEPYMGKGPDILAYQILDKLVEHYQPVLDRYEEEIDRLEDEIFTNQAKDFLSSIMQVKRDVFHFRKIIAPQRDTLNYLARNESSIIRAEHMIYFRDVYDHLFRVYGTVDGFYEALSGILQGYFSHTSNKLNVTIQRMTVMATLSMPAVMVASIYGMNFKHMPELDHPHGYFITLAGIFALTTALVVWMKIKKWF